MDNMLNISEVFHNILEQLTHDMTFLSSPVD